MKDWRVTYEHLEDKARRMPFWKREEKVQADTRDEAIHQIRSAFPPPRYGNFKASVVRQTISSVG